MRSKIVSFSIDEMLYNQYIAPISENRSMFIRNMFIDGCLNQEIDNQTHKVRIIELNQKLFNLSEEIKRLKALNARYFKALGGKTPEEKEKEREYQARQTISLKEIKAFQESGLLQDIAEGNYKKSK
jgi:hypothetical protein